MIDNLELSDKFIVTPTGLQIVGNPTFDEWMAYGQTLWAMRSAIQWAIADWLRYGEGEYGEKYAQAMDARKVSEHTLQNYAWVGSKFDASRRRGSLSFSHHEAVAAIPDPAIQDELLTQAANEHLGREAIRELAKPHKPARPTKTPPAPPPPLPQAQQTVVPVLGGHALVFSVSNEKATLRIDNPALLDALKEAQRCDYPVYVMIQRTSTRPHFTEVVDAMAKFGRTSTRLPIGKVS